MGATTNYGFRYPDPGADPNVPYDMQALATDVDTTLKASVDSLSANPAASTYNPTLTGVAAQAGTVSAEFTEHGGMVVGRVAFKVAAAPTGEVKIGFPLATKSLPVGVHTFGVAVCRDDSAGLYIAGQLMQVVDVAGAITASTIYVPASGTNTNTTKVASATFPIPWAAGDQIAVTFQYAKG